MDRINTEQEDSRYTPGQVRPVISSPPFGSLASEAYDTLYGAGQWYRANIQRPTTSFLQQYQNQGSYRDWPSQGLQIFQNLPTGLAIGVVNTPAIALETAGAAVVGSAFMARDPASFPARAAQGLGMQYQAVSEGIRTRPAEFAGEMLGTVLLTKGAGKAAGFAAKASPVRVRTVEIPTGRTVKNPYYSERVPAVVNRVAGIEKEIPTTTRYTGIVRENVLANKIKNVPPSEGARAGVGLITRTDPATGRTIRTVAVGNPVKSFGNTPIGSGYMPETAAEFAVARPVMESRLSGADLAVFRSGLAFKNKLINERVNLPPIERYGQIAPRGMTEAQWKAAQAYTEANAGDVMPYGSTVGRSFYSKYMRHDLGDFDADIKPALVTKHSEGYLNAIAQPEGWTIKKIPDPRNAGKFIYEASDGAGARVASMKYQGSQLTGGRYVATDLKGQTLLDLHPYYQSEWKTSPFKSVIQKIRAVDEWAPVQQGKIRTVSGKFVPMGKIQFFLEGGYVETKPGVKAVIRGMAHRHKDTPDISHSARYMAGVKFREAAEGIQSGKLRSVNQNIRSGREYIEIADAYRDYIRETVKKGELNPEALEFLKQGKDPVGRLRNLKEVQLSTAWNEEATLLPGRRTSHVPRESQRIANARHPEVFRRDVRSRMARGVIDRESSARIRERPTRAWDQSSESGISSGVNYRNLQTRSGRSSEIAPYPARGSTGYLEKSGASPAKGIGEYLKRSGGPSPSRGGGSPSKGGSPSPVGGGTYPGGGGGGGGPSPTGGGGSYKDNPGGPYMGPPPIPKGPPPYPNTPPPSETPRDRTRTRFAVMAASIPARRRRKEDEDLLRFTGAKERKTAPFLEMAPVASHLEMLKGITNAKRHRKTSRKFI